MNPILFYLVMTATYIPEDGIPTHIVIETYKTFEECQKGLLPARDRLHKRKEYPPMTAACFAGPDLPWKRDGK